MIAHERSLAEIDLQKAMPALEAAEKAVNGLKS